MKNVLKISAMLFVTLLAVSCSKDDSNEDMGNQTSADVNQVRNTAVSGTWRISYFWDSDKDETSNFSGYVFTFNQDGTVTAVKSNATVNGTWAVDNSSNSSSSSSSDPDFVLLFAVPQDNDFDDLNDDWDIVSVSQTQIELTDVSGGNGGTDFLTFTKN